MLSIILEGLDKTGKSTLAKKLHKEFGFNIVKCSQPKPGNAFNEYYKKMQSINNKDYTVFDRFHLGELAYGPVYRGKSQLTKQQFKKLEKLSKSKNTIIIFCTDSKENIAKRFKKDKEEFTNEKDIEKLQLLFGRALHKTKLPIVIHRIKTVNDLTKGNSLHVIIRAFERLYEDNKL